MTTVQSLIDEYDNKMSKAGGDILKIANLNREFVIHVRELSSPIGEILSELQKMVKEPCKKESNFWLSAAREHPSLTYLEPLCSILIIEDNCIWHEGVIQILQELKDERAIPALEKALNYDFDTDAWNRIAIDCLDALAEIGTEAAINVIKKYTTSPIERVSEEAKDILKYLNP